ncbi:MAG: hypothetical protein GY822_12895 [Deltaproteobacteria bacterium]|nr:hypothetical protein [Deltaproteobacteria bacterium]
MQDLGFANGTRLNGEVISGPRFITARDEIGMMGNGVKRVSIGGASGGVSTSNLSSILRKGGKIVALGGKKKGGAHERAKTQDEATRKGLAQQRRNYESAAYLLRQGDDMRRAVVPGHAQARTDLGCLYEQKKRHKDAKRELMRALKDEPRLGNAWYCLAFAENYLASDKEMIFAFRRATQVQPDHAEAFFQLGKKLLDQGNKQGEKKAFAGVVKARSKYENALLQLEPLHDVVAPVSGAGTATKDGPK